MRARRLLVLLILAFGNTWALAQAPIRAPGPEQSRTDAPAVASAVILSQGQPADDLADALPVPFRVFNASHGLPQNTVYALALGHDGMLYAGTEDGLSRYDGKRFHKVELPHGNMATAVNALFPDGSGLWVGTDQDGLWRGDGDSWRRVGDDQGRPRSINAISAAPAGGVWLASEEGVFHCDQRACRQDTRFGSEPAARILQGRYLGQDALWLARDGIGLHAYRLAADNAQSLLILSRDNGLPNNSIRALRHWPEESETLWIGTGRGLARLDGQRLTAWRDDAVPGMAGVFDFSVLAGSDGTEHLIAASFGAGLLQFDSDVRWTRLGTEQGLPENHLFAALSTHQGLWLGTSNSGLARLDPGRWQYFNERHGLPHSAVIGIGRNVFRDGKEYLWLGTISGSVYRKERQWLPFLPEPYRRWPLVDLQRTRDGTLWLATDNGLLRWTDQGIQRYSVDNSEIPGVSIMDLELQQTAAGERLWVLTRHGLARIVDGVPRLVELTELPAQGGRKLLSVPSLEGGSLFIAGRGLGWLRGETTVEWMGAPCLPHDDVHTVAVRNTKQGSELWVGGRGGLTRVRFSGGRPQCSPVARISGWVFQVAVDASGEVYSFGYEGVFRLRLNPEDDLADLSEATVTRYDIEDGLPDLAFNRASMRDGEGRIWIGSARGAALFDPSHHPTSEPNSRFDVLAASADGINIAPNARLTEQASSLRFSWRLLSFAGENQIRYRTQLLGLDQQASDWHDDTELELIRLPAGSYELRIWARDAAGAEFGPIQFPFVILQPWWQRWWAWLLFSLALIGCGLALGRLRERALARQAARLEALVKERTTELAAANQQLEQWAMTDPLTGCFNRRCFYERYADASRAKSCWWLMLDIDHFKKINDIHGHDAGDAVLIEFARRMRELTPRCFRMGGEEFVMLWPGTRADTNPGDSSELGTVLRALADTPVQLGAQSLRVTCSVGALWVPEGTDDNPGTACSERLRSIDQALYRAKSAGRDRAVQVLNADIASASFGWREVRRSGHANDGVRAEFGAGKA